MVNDGDKLYIMQSQAYMYDGKTLLTFDMNKNKFINQKDLKYTGQKMQLKDNKLYVLNGNLEEKSHIMTIYDIKNNFNVLDEISFDVKDNILVDVYVK